MKKRLWANIVFVVLISLGSTICSEAMELVPVTSFDSSWVIETNGTGTGTLTTDGEKINLSAQSSSTGDIAKYFIKTGTTGVVGMVATIRVDQTSSGSTGDCGIGIRQWIGKIGNSKIQLAMSLGQISQLNNQKYISYRVQAQDLTTNATRVLFNGVFGGLNGSNWANGDSKTMAFARVGSEYWFYVAGEPGLIKIQAFDVVTSYDGDPKVFTWAQQGAGNSISGSVSDIYLIKE